MKLIIFLVLSVNSPSPFHSFSNFLNGSQAVSTLLNSSHLFLAFLNPSQLYSTILNFCQFVWTLTSTFFHLLNFSPLLYIFSILFSSFLTSSQLSYLGNEKVWEHVTSQVNTCLGVKARDFRECMVSPGILEDMRNVGWGTTVLGAHLCFRCMLSSIENYLSVDARRVGTCCDYVHVPFANQVLRSTSHETCNEAFSHA